MKKTILISGGTGLIGNRLRDYLGTERYDFRILTRSKSKVSANKNYYLWNPAQNEMDSAALNNVDIVINLAGAGIADKRWTDERKQLLLDSRVDSIKTLAKYLKASGTKLQLLIGASAIGLYGDRGEERLTEQDERGKGFLADITETWENAYKTTEPYVMRSMIMRIGIVLSSKGGALKEILKPGKAGVFGYFGDGSAYYSWIHIDDICEIIHQAIFNDAYKGIVNATAPEPISIKQLVSDAKSASGRPGLLMPVPGFGLKLILGEMATMLLNSTRVI
ncbi:MAG: TIGR01777 family protein, partial [Saprospiraceae bacterium]|nr:TIGR01777 family protein [Saprospiraceae bacterium]